MERSSSTRLIGEPGRSPVSLPEVSAIPSQERIQTVSTVIVDRSAVFRAGLMHALSGTQFCVVAECAHFRELDRTIFDSPRNLFLVNVEEKVDEIHKYLSSVQNNKNYIVLLGNTEDDEFESIINLKFDGYMSKNEITLDFLLKSLNIIVSDGVVLSFNFLNKLRSEWVNKSRTNNEAREATSHAREIIGKTSLPVEQGLPQELLSNRETAVLMRLMQGSSNKHIARQLDIAEATVKVHVKSVLRKIRVQNRTQAAMWASSHLSHQMATAGGSSARSDTVESLIGNSIS